MKKTSKIWKFKIAALFSVLALISSCTNTTTVKLSPTLATTPVSTITGTSAITGGTITFDGGATIIERGVCWNTSANPTIKNNKLASTVATTVFANTVTGLTPSTTYYLRAYATNSEGLSYGNEITFTTTDGSAIVAPTITTTAATALAATSATSGGNITSDGGAPVTARGVCWSITSGPTTALSTKTTDGTGTGIFSSNLTGLTLLSTYYVRAYATNSAGTTYGNEIMFTTTQTSTMVVPTLTTTAASAISQTTATSGGNITADGGAAVTARGICWSTTANPTTALSTRTSDGTGTGVFSSNMSGLASATTYHVRAYATNIIGTAYGSEITFTTQAPALVVPTLTTAAATAISQTTATSGGNISSDGGAAVTVRGVCWSTSSGPTVALSTKTSDGTGTGAFSSNIAGLASATTYHIRAYATNSVGTAYGSEITFTTATTVTLVVPSITTTAASGITQTTATSGGNVTADGGATVSARGVCWNTSSGPTVALSTKTANGTGTGAFSSSLTGLSAGTTYYVRSYATNSVGTAYGSEIIFTTMPTVTLVVPTLTTTAISAIGTTTATSGGNVSADGGATVTARGVCWSTSSGPTISLGTKTSDGTGLGAFTSSLTGLGSSTTYYARAYATNSVGTAYGNEVSFTTTAASSNTPGTLTVSTLTSQAGGQYSPKNVVAIWIENSSGAFVKSLLVLANARKADLTNWSSNSARNVVNATTGATQSGHAVRTATWNGTNVSGVVVADGTYKVCFELTDGTLRFSTFNFTKGPTAFSLAPANVSSFANISIVWTP